MLLLVFLFFMSASSQLLNKDDCNKTKSCFSEPPSCTSSRDCKYLLKYSVASNEQSVEFELSSMRYQWIAVGFNPKTKSMAGGEALACETNGNKVELQHYNMPEKSRPYPSEDTNATLMSSNISASILSCKIKRKLDLGVMKRTNLSNPVYFLYAAGNMKEENTVIRKHAYDDVSSVLLKASTLSDNSDTSVAEKRIDTSQCGKTLGCLRVPSGCNDNTDCNFLLTFAKNATYVVFSVSGKSNGWVAVGFNDQPKMGGTDAVICQPRGPNIALSVANLEYDRPDLNNANEIKLVEGRFEGGIIYCKFTRPLKATSNQRLSIDVSRYIIYGKGSGSSTLNKHEDGDKGCSKKKVDFDKNILYALDECEGNRIEQVHASFMIFAWMFLVVISIFIARYSRSLWKGWKIFGSDAWFQFHRLIMGLAVLMTIIAIIMIFVDKEGWSESAGDHAIFGIIVLVLSIIQPTIAFFRPHPDTPRRPIFNWFHRIVALLLVIFVVVAVFEGAELLEDSGGDTVSKVLIALIVIAIITALILEYLAFRLKKTIPLETNIASGELQEAKLDGSEPFWETKIQSILLVLFTLVVFILAVVMIARVAGAGSDDDDDGD